LSFDGGGANDDELLYSASGSANKTGFIVTAVCDVNSCGKYKISHQVNGYTFGVFVL